MTDRLRILPDTEGQVAGHLGQLEELLLQLQPHDDDEPAAPSGLGADALEAVQRILGAVLAADRRPAVQLLGAGGSFELVPLHALDLDPTDLATVGQAIAAIGRGLLAKHDLVSNVVQQFTSSAQVAPGDLVASFARAHGVLDVAADDDTHTLAALITSGPGPLVLTSTQEGAYERLTGRTLAMFHLNDPLERFLYRGTER